MKYFDATVRSISILRPSIIGAHSASPGPLSYAAILTWRRRRARINEAMADGRQALINAALPAIGDVFVSLSGASNYHHR